MDKYDPTGAGMYRSPKWLCYVDGQGEGGRTWSSRQPTMEQARKEAAELFGVAPEKVKVETWGDAAPMTDEPWIEMPAVKPPNT